MHPLQRVLGKTSALLLVGRELAKLNRHGGRMQHTRPAGAEARRHSNAQVLSRLSDRPGKSFSHPVKIEAATAAQLQIDICMMSL
jgi:hypothetical protein